MPIVLLLLLTLLPAGAEELYFKNRPFPGPVTGGGDEAMVGLVTLAGVLNLKVGDVNGGHYLGRPGAPGREATSAGTVCVEGKTVDSKDDGSLTVNLRQTVQALGLELKPGPGGVVNLVVPPNWARGSSGSTPRSAADGPALPDGPVPPLEVNQKTPGAVVDINPLLERGRINLVLLYDVESKEFFKLLGLADQLARVRGDVYVIKISAGKQDVSPMAKSMQDVGRIPQLRVYRRSGRLANVAGGHSLHDLMQSWIKDPKLIDEYIQKHGIKP